MNNSNESGYQSMDRSSFKTSTPIKSEDHRDIANCFENYEYEENQAKHRLNKNVEKITKNLSKM